MTYDSTNDTNAHIDLVRKNLREVRHNLERRGILHDQSKLESPEKELMDELTPKLRQLTYGSEEYKKSAARIGESHYKKNPHHPEYWENGINGMSLLDIIEMLCDWYAATQRHSDGNLAKSLTINKERFKIEGQLAGIIENTYRELGWLEEGEEIA